MKQFAPPDPRLEDKVRVIQFPAQRDVLNVASRDCQSEMIQPGGSASDEIARLAALDPAEFEQQRKPVAKQLKLRLSELDRLVKAERSQHDQTSLQGRAVSFAVPEPWPHPVDGAELLEELADCIGKYVVMSVAERVIAALWVVHTYLIEVFQISPRLAITSPEKGCGKTTLLDVIARLVPRPLLNASITGPATFRIVEMHQPTLLIDEADTFLGDNDALRGVLNSGHRKGGFTIRTVGDQFEPRAFSTYSACAIALIGKLPGTLADRSLPIDLRRRRPDEVVKAFRSDRTAELDQVARKVARWVADHADRVRDADPLMPAGVFNRVADNWRPLLAIADAAGGEWPQQARRAAQFAVPSAPRTRSSQTFAPSSPTLAWTA